MDRLEFCETCTMADYAAIVLFVLFPPAGFYLLVLRRNGWKFGGTNWQEYMLVAGAIAVWFVIFVFSTHLASGAFAANVALFFALGAVAFLGISIPASEYLARSVVSLLASIVSIELAVSTALDWDKALPRNPCSPEMQRIGLIGIAFSVALFVALPKVSRQPTLLAGLTSQRKTASIDSVVFQYTFLLISALVLPFFFKSFPNFILIWSCSLH